MLKIQKSSKLIYLYTTHTHTHGIPTDKNTLMFFKLYVLRFVSNVMKVIRHSMKKYLVFFG